MRANKAITDHVLSRLHPDLVPLAAEVMRRALARRGHRRTFRKRTSIYLPGRVKNALMVKIEAQEGRASEDRGYIFPYEFLTETLGLKVNKRRKKKG